VDAEPPKLASPPRLATPAAIVAKADTAKGPPVLLAPKAPEVARPKGVTFRNGDWHGSHDCPACGRQQLVIYAGGKYGPHTHRCPVDGTVWRH
jgi:hypothetical protein